ncbi:MAG: hypothetical protein K5873_08875 [Treponema sp.]|nr:hypothetical protein [Treponema sp.]
MKKLSRLSLLLLSLFVLSFFSACSNGNENDASNPEAASAVSSITFNTNIPGQISGKTFPVSVKIPETAFDDARIFNKNLAIVSFAATLQTGSEESVRKFYSDTGFDNIKTKENYDYKSSESIAYSFAHKEIAGRDIVIVLTRSLKYCAEWGNNFLLGESGDHEGFFNAATKVYDGLKSYIESNYAESYNKKTLKLWIAGYSRGGAVSNILSYLILSSNSEKKLDISEENVFSYTFESPNCLSTEHAEAFPNVFNVYSEADLIPNVVLKKFGFGRCGTDKILFDGESGYTAKIKKGTENEDGYVTTEKFYVSPVDQALADLDESVLLPGFMIQYSTNKANVEASFDENTCAYNSEKAFINTIIETLTEKDGTSKGGYSANTRQLYARTIQPHISYAMSIIMQDDTILNELGELAKSNPLKALDWLSSEDALYNDLVEVIDKKNIVYDSAKLKECCTAFFCMIYADEPEGCFHPLVSKLTTNVLAQNKDLQRIVAQHRSEPIYALLLKLE